MSSKAERLTARKISMQEWNGQRPPLLTLVPQNETPIQKTPTRRFLNKNTLLGIGTAVAFIGGAIGVGAGVTTVYDMNANQLDQHQTRQDQGVVFIESAVAIGSLAAMLLARRNMSSDQQLR
ncbi:MAG TPA: hypothetical protein VLF68_05315 [Candidatus Saccharimonadales bacterium]|nr:hypothetical protein [Candidatus Saccharimonadales bacterium]